VCSFVFIFCLSVCSSVYLVCCCTKCTNYIIIIAPFHEEAPSQKRSGMARVVDLPTTRLSTNGMNHICLSFADHERMEGWFGLGITTVSKRSAHDRYMMNIAVCTFLAVKTVTHHWAGGRKQLAHRFYPEWGNRVLNPRPLGSRATALTTTPLRHRAGGYPFRAKHPVTYYYYVELELQRSSTVLCFACRHAFSTAVVLCPSLACRWRCQSGVVT